eukprot:TRINITY_DN13484_c0_g1_i1.p1 TRINITY_DN13484_c0_g1~~TRINITY_DN13484_c0_g1_i1.p1  ORF type:complete len:329 (-),score=61.23 TRINITY_DN13484_c0_g1_i1:225-1211(-)
MQQSSENQAQILSLSEKLCSHDVTNSLQPPTPRDELLDSLTEDISNLSINQAKQETSSTTPSAENVGSEPPVEAVTSQQHAVENYVSNHSETSDSTQLVSSVVGDTKISEMTQEELESSIMGDDHSTVVTLFNVDIMVKDLKCLRPGQWLNDEIINCYMEMLNTWANKRLLKVHCFSSFFLTMLAGGYRRVKRWTRSKDVFSMDRIIFPVNLNNTHWCLVVINMKAKKIEYYDSLGGRNDKIFKQIRMWLQEESLDKKKEYFDPGDYVDEYPAAVPLQQNSYDCGVFTCKFAEARVNGDEPFSFSQSDMPSFRRRIWQAILKKQLDDS